MNIKDLPVNMPDWIINGVHFVVKTGSHAYGINNENSDIDIYGFCCPPIQNIFPRTAGEIFGFGRQLKRFEQFQQEGIQCNNEIYDLSIYNITKYFQLCMDNNPNMIDTLFVPEDCIMYESSIGKMIRENRNIFLHKGSYWRFLGYASSQLSKIRNKNPEGKRKLIVDKYGFDTKYASHLVRLALECEQILSDHNLDLRKNKDILLFIRNGGMKLSEIENWFVNKKEKLQLLYETSCLQDRPDENKIKKILVECLEMHYGKLNKFIFPEI